MSEVRLGHYGGYFGDYDTILPHDKVTCHICNPNLNMDEETAVAYLRAGRPVVCDRNTYEAASRRVSAEQQLEKALLRMKIHSKLTWMR